jgi:hypothetical protein
MAEARLSTVYTSDLPFDSGLPDSLAICCVDGRFGRQMRQFIEDGLGWHQADRFIIPGGPAWLLLERSMVREQDVTRAHLEFLIRHHDIQRVALIGHADCGYYQMHLGYTDADARYKVQVADLRQAALTFRMWFPVVPEVSAYFAGLAGGEVVFEALPDRP